MKVMFKIKLKVQQQFFTAAMVICCYVKEIIIDDKFANDQTIVSYYFLATAVYCIVKIDLSMNRLTWRNCYEPP